MSVQLERLIDEREGGRSRSSALALALRLLNGLDDYITEAMLVVVTITTTVAVVYRYLLNNSLDWSDEVGRMLLVYMVFIGSGAALKQGGHFGLELTMWLPRRVQTVLALVIELVGIGFAVALIWYGRDFVDVGTLSRTSTTDISLSWIYVAVPICGGLYLVRTLWRIVEIVRRGAPLSRELEP